MLAVAVLVVLGALALVRLGPRQLTMLVGGLLDAVLLGGIVCAQAWQARREARVLEGAFGDAYRAYRRRTWW